MCEIQKLLERRNLPPLLTGKNGKPVTAGTWRARRAELLEILETEIYGTAPAAPERMDVEVLDEGKQYSGFAGKAKVRELRFF